MTAQRSKFPAALAQLDLNLLLTLDTLLEMRSVTASAERFGVTQSAMSHRLARLREFFEDSLLVAAGDKLVLTPKAESLQGPLREALTGLREAVMPEPPFAPAETVRTFTVASADLAEITLLPRWIPDLARKAPGVNIRMAGRGAVRGEALIAGSVDLAIGPGQGTVPGAALQATAGIRQRKLLTEGFAVLARGNHPRVQGPLSLEQYLDESHCLVSPDGRPGSVVDARLAEQGKQRVVAVRLAHFLSAPFLVAQTDHLLTCPTSLAEAVAKPLGLRILRPPLELPRTAILLYWHERLHDDPAHRWLRDGLMELTAAFRNPG